MKYILRIVVVIAIIAGIVFGIKYCNSITSNDAQFINIVEQTFVVAEDLKTNFETEATNEVFDSAKKPTNALNKLNSSKEKLNPFMAEIYFAENIKGEDINELETLSKSIKDNYDKYISTMAKLKTLNSSDGAYAQYKANYENQIVNAINGCADSYLNYSIKVLEMIKTYVHNNSEANAELNSAILVLEGMKS